VLPRWSRRARDGVSQAVYLNRPCAPPYSAGRCQSTSHELARRSTGDCAGAQPYASRMNLRTEPSDVPLGSFASG